MRYNEERYNLVSEIHYNNKWYYITNNGLLLRIKRDVALPNHPMVSMTKYNQKRLFETVDLNSISGELEKLVTDEFNRLTEDNLINDKKRDMEDFYNQYG